MSEETPCFPEFNLPQEVFAKDFGSDWYVESEEERILNSFKSQEYDSTLYHLLIKEPLAKHSNEDTSSGATPYNSWMINCGFDITNEKDFPYLENLHDPKLDEPLHNGDDSISEFIVNIPESLGDEQVGLPFSEMKDITDLTVKEQKHSELYGGAKNTNSRNKSYIAEYASRRDVVYKGIIRGTKEVLQADFYSATKEITFSRKRHGCHIFKKKVKDFYENSEFKKTVDELYPNDAETEERFIEALAIFLEMPWYYPDKRKEFRQASTQLRKCCSKYTNSLYKKLFKFDGLQLFYKILLKSGYIHSLIRERKNMMKLEERYIEGVVSIIDFNKSGRMME
ncbi:unnamed protein product [Moneuplotes crassus]|uniref:Uncharacterized protein n=1 Tax=Euplotes crassus TaxID=5936 RepID=A0AAD2DA30_EUPCR|nr:unnamed protein product [Moneuplotes crassus]